MRIVSIKLEDSLLAELEGMMQRHRYATKTEFIREAIRERMKQLEIEERLRKVDRLYGASKRKTTDAQLHKVREKVWKEMEGEIRKDPLAFARD